MTRTLRVLFDVDGVLADFVGPCLEEIRHLTGKRFTREDVKEWDIMKSLGIPSAQAAEIYDHMRREGFCRSLPVYPGAQDGFEKIKSLGVEIYMVTSPFRGAHWTHERDEWLHEHFHIATDHIVHTSAKHLCVGDVFIDDKYENLATWKEHQEGLAVHWATPHNEHLPQARSGEMPVLSLGPRTNNWDVLYGMVDVMIRMLVDGDE